jgi:hypothetical protein
MSTPSPLLVRCRCTAAAAKPRRKTAGFVRHASAAGRSYPRGSASPAVVDAAAPTIDAGRIGRCWGEAGVRRSGGPRFPSWHCDSPAADASRTKGVVRLGVLGSGPMLLDRTNRRRLVEPAHVAPLVSLGKPQTVAARCSAAQERHRDSALPQCRAGAGAGACIAGTSAARCRPLRARRHCREAGGCSRDRAAVASRGEPTAGPS